MLMYLKPRGGSAGTNTGIWAAFTSSGNWFLFRKEGCLRSHRSTRMSTGPAEWKTLPAGWAGKSSGQRGNNFRYDRWYNRTLPSVVSKCICLGREPGLGLIMKPPKVPPRPPLRRAVTLYIKVPNWIWRSRPVSQNQRIASGLAR
jgi:hypothetical protein